MGREAASVADPQLFFINGGYSSYLIFTFVSILQVSKSSLEFIRFEAEIENYSSMENVIAKLDMRTIKLSGNKILFFDTHFFLLVYLVFLLRTLNSSDKQSKFRLNSYKIILNILYYPSDLSLNQVSVNL